MILFTHKNLHAINIKQRQTYLENVDTSFKCNVFPQTFHNFWKDLNNMEVIFFPFNIFCFIRFLFKTCVRNFVRLGTFLDSLVNLQSLEGYLSEKLKSNLFISPYLRLNFSLVLFIDVFALSKVLIFEIKEITQTWN